MKHYTEKEISHIKIQEWDKGWRCGLLVATALWVVPMIIVSISFS